MNLRSHILGAMGHLLGASTVSRALGLARGLIVAKLLAPQLYGVSAAVAVIIAYAQYADLGSSTSAYRGLTSALGRADPLGAARWAGSMSALKLTSAVVVGLGSLLVSLWPGLDPSLALGLRFLPLIAVSSCLLSLAILYWQAHGETRAIGRATALAAALDFSLSVTLTRLFGLPGLLSACVLASALAWGWALQKGGGVRPSFPPARDVRDLISTGLPLVALGLIDHNLVYLDHLVVLAFFSLRDLGVYNIALIAADLVRMLGLTAGIVLGPALIRHYSRAGFDVVAIRQHTLLPVHLLASLVPFAIAPIWIGGGYVLVQLYPLYTAAVRPMRILLLAFYFLLVNGGVTSFLFAIDKHRRNLLIAGPAVLLNVILDILLIRAGFGLVAVAAGSLLTFVAYAIVHLGYVAQHFSLRPREWVWFYAGAFLPGAYLVVVLYVVEGLRGGPDSFWLVTAACLASWLLLSPLALWGLRVARRIDLAIGSESPSHALER